MEASGILWRNAANGAGDDEETDDEDSFFDLVFKSPDRVAVRRGDEAVKKDFQFIESPRDVLLSKSGLSISDSKDFSPVTLLRSTPKFSVFFMFRKPSRCEKIESNGELKGSPFNLFSKSSKIDENNRFSVKCRVEEMPIASNLARDNSLRSQLLKETSDYETLSDKSSRDAVPKYLKLIKPLLYLKIWKRQNEKAKLTDSLTPSSTPVNAPVDLSSMKFSEGSRAGSFKIVTKRLGKSRSASAAIGLPPPPARRRDDSMLEQREGIQGAVLYCKKSYNSSSKVILRTRNWDITEDTHAKFQTDAAFE
ncbi:hypothetical protein DH2020_048621 [Rehmannia glutinosa]|uniref:Membrane-associated kinase regulator 2 n=1 Tax=Rehmannia glutinosa TaxID=99300 RepID=A0ABR0U5S8_REHGL